MLTVDLGFRVLTFCSIAMAGEIPEMSVRTTELPIPQRNAANKPSVQRSKQQALQKRDW